MATTVSTATPWFSIALTACNQADSELASSPEISVGRLIGRAPNVSDTPRISSSSELTQTESMWCACRACRIDQAISGLPQTSIRFFLGMPLDPPRAGIIATVKLTAYNPPENQSSPKNKFSNRNYTNPL